MRAVLLAWLALAAPLALPPAASVVGLADDAGSGRDAPEAPVDLVRVRPGVVYQATHDLFDPEDHYAFEAQGGDVVHATATGEYACLSVTDGAGAEAARVCVLGNAWPGELQARLPSSGLWFLRHATTWAPALEDAPREAKPGAYRFSFGLNAPAPHVLGGDAQDDAGSGRDAPGEPIPLVAVEPGRAYAGALLGFPLDGADHYAFEARAGDAADVLATGEGACLALVDAAGAELAVNCGEGQRHHALQAVLPADGTYYFRYDAPAPIAYAFSLGLNAPAPDLLLDLQDDAGTGRDAPGGPVPLARVEPGRVYEATVLASADPSDHYAFEARAGDVVHARATGAALSFLRVLDPSGALLRESLVIGQVPLTALTVTLPADGTYYFAYDAFTTEPYWFSLGLNQPAPQLPVPQFIDGFA